MKARRREKLAFDALDDLVVHLGGLRDERKAVLAVTEGWLEYGPNPALARPLKSDQGRVPRPPGPVDRGTQRRSDEHERRHPEQVRERPHRAGQHGHRDRLPRLAERANRVNVSFYPVGAQGLAVFDTASTKSRSTRRRRTRAVSGTRRASCSWTRRTCGPG